METRAQQGVVVLPMQIGDLRPLFPLIQARNPTLSWPRWQSYAKRIARSKQGSREGVLVARRGASGLPCGAVCYRVVQDLRFGRSLTVEHLVAIDLLYPQDVRAALAAALEQRAVELGCDVIRAIVPSGDAEVVETLHLAGHRDEGLTFTKSCLRPRA